VTADPATASPAEAGPVRPAGRRFPRVLRALRQRRGWSQDRLADELGGLRSQWSDYERGARQPNLGRVRAADRALSGHGALLKAYVNDRIEALLAEVGVAA
jgi:transcriptional regulator with XRE-family HTH domain